MKRILLLISVLFLLLPCLSISACAEEESPATEAVPPEYTDFLESIPEELRELLPDSLFSNDCKTLEDATRSMSHFSYLLRLSLSILGESLPACLSLLASVCGLLLLSSVLRAFRDGIRSDGIGRAFSFCASLTKRGKQRAD